MRSSKTSERHASDASKVFRRRAGPGCHPNSNKRGAKKDRRFAGGHIRSDLSILLGFGDPALKSREQCTIRGFGDHGQFGI
jgi:hypothetical protein